MVIDTVTVGDTVLVTSLDGVTVGEAFGVLDLVLVVVGVGVLDLVTVAVGVGPFGCVFGPPQGLMGLTVQEDVYRTQDDQGSGLDRESHDVDRLRLFIVGTIVAFSRQGVFAAR